MFSECDIHPEHPAIGKMSGAKIRSHSRNGII